MSSGFKPRSQKSVTAYFPSKQLQPYGFTDRRISPLCYIIAIVPDTCDGSDDMDLFIWSFLRFHILQMGC